MINKITFCGKGGAGKTYASSILEQYNYKHISFAEPIYKIKEEVFLDKTKNRALTILIGEKLREIDKNIIVNCAFGKAKQFEKVSIDDMRKQEELKRGIENGFIPVRIVTNEELRIERLVKRDGEVDVPSLNKPIEKELDLIPMITIVNNGTKKEFEFKILSVIENDLTDTYFGTYHQVLEWIK